MTSTIRMKGELVGLRLAGAGSTVVHGEIVRVLDNHRPDGPAMNSLILVEILGDGPKARYISWINYFDIEYAKHREPGVWRIVEPAEPFKREVVWMPYGWRGGIEVPVIGDSMRFGSTHFVSAGERS